MRSTPGWRAPVALVLALVAVTPACGKKGPPLQPLVRLPGPVLEFSAKRLGSTIYATFAVPAKNQDNSTPADIVRVEVYGFTGKPENNDEIVKYGTLVASVPVRQPPSPEEEEQAARHAGQPPPKGGRRAPEVEPGFDQGATVTVTEALTQASFEPVVVARRQKRDRPLMPVVAPVLLPVPSFAELPARTYVAVGVNHKGRRGVFSPRVAVPLVEPPGAPSRLTVTYTETAFTLTWTPPAGAPLPPVAPAPAAAEPDVIQLVGRPIITAATPAWSYDVFDVTPVKPAQDANLAPAVAPPPRVAIPVPLNPTALAPASFTDPRAMVFDTERCYAVRTLETFGTMVEESDPSQAACVTPRDTFPPAAPQGLIAVATSGSISLNWQPNTEADLAGYLVLRGEAPGTALTPLTPAPIAATTYDDKTVTSGVRYVYAVVAVDKATPPNVSAQSNRIEETAR